MKKIELFLLCWLSALLAMAGQQSDSFIIQGKITDEQNRPIANVVVNDGINFTTTDAMVCTRSIRIPTSVILCASACRQLTNCQLTSRIFFVSICQ